MSTLIDFWEKPTAKEIYMIAGWRQWADAGAISSGLPPYMIEKTGARKIGEMKGCWLLLIPDSRSTSFP